MALTPEQQQKFEKIKMALPAEKQHLLSRFPNALPEVFMEGYEDGLRSGEIEGRAIGRKKGMESAKLSPAEIAKIESEARIAQQANHEKAKMDWLLDCFEGRVIFLRKTKNISTAAAIAQIAADYPDAHADFLKRSKTGQVLKMEG